MSYWNRYALAVDDDPQCVNTLRLMLRFCGFHHIVAAEDGFVALEYLKEWRFDLVVSDWNMGTMDGVELLMRVRRDPTTANVPFILVTGSLTEPPWRGAIEHGATEFLLKPFTLGALRSACHFCLELKEFEGANVTPLRAPLKDRLRRRLYPV